MRYLISWLATLTWLCGIVIAQGFWSTLFAIIFPLWAWYLVAEKFVTRYL